MLLTRAATVKPHTSQNLLICTKSFIRQSKSRLLPSYLARACKPSVHGLTLKDLNALTSLKRLAKIAVTT